MDRRKFLKTSCLTCVGSLGIVSLLESCSTQKYISNYAVIKNTVEIKKSEFTVVKKGKTFQQKFILIKPEALQFPIVIYQLKDNEYKALFLKCSHQGCELSPYETAMVCPCHGAEFNTKGEVTQGPADTNLKSFVTTQDNENIYIQL